MVRQRKDLTEPGTGGMIVLPEAGVPLNAGTLQRSGLVARLRSQAVCATICQDCGAELRKPSDVMRHDCPIAAARATRLGNREPVSPSHLYALCQGNTGLYHHAMREAGYVVETTTGQPEDPCSICGWSANGK